MKLIFYSIFCRKPLTRSIATSMAKSKFEYVKEFEREDICLQNCWIVIRLDGRNYSKFCDAHKFTKPNDINALGLMNQAATKVMEDFNEICLAYGQSDEYSFIFRKDAQVYNRRAYKLVSNVNSLFSASYVYHWAEFFKDKKLLYPPSFDARVILYPSDKNLRDYLSWRQADTHINNLYNTCFWALVIKGQLTPYQAQERLKGSVASEKNEILFHEFNTNYNKEPEIFRKGTTLLRKLITQGTGQRKTQIVPVVEDMIGDRFWKDHPELIKIVDKMTNIKLENTSNIL